MVQGKISNNDKRFKSKEVSLSLQGDRKASEKHQRSIKGCVGYDHSAEK